jgi:archaellum biogenesis protein FlaJ (TadC family)
LSSKQERGTIVKKYALAVGLALMLAGAADAAITEIISTGASTRVAPQAAYLRLSAADLAAVRHAEIIAVPTNMSELPEPEVFAMMLVGLVLIGYRASRDSSDKFQ